MGRAVAVTPRVACLPRVAALLRVASLLHCCCAALVPKPPTPAAPSPKVPKPPHSGYHIRGRRGAFEGWYHRLSLPSDAGVPSVFIYSIFDPEEPQSPRHGVALQLLGVGMASRLLEAPSKGSFWADEHRLALGHTTMGVPLRQPSSPRAFERFVQGGYPQHDPHPHPDPDPDPYPNPNPDANQTLTNFNPNPDPDPNPSPNPPNPNSPGGWQLTATQHQGRLEDGSVSWCYTIAPKLGWGGGSEAKQYSTAGWLAALPVFEPHYQVKP